MSNVTHDVAFNGAEAILKFTQSVGSVTVNGNVPISVERVHIGTQVALIATENIIVGRQYPGTGDQQALAGSIHGSAKVLALA